MTSTPALAYLLLGASSKSSANPLITLLPLVAIGVLGYFFFIRPQQRKAQAARQAQSSGIEVGDEVQTVGGVIGTVLEIHGDRYTLLTGHLGEDGNLDGPQPTRIVFVRQAIARKIEPIDDVRVADDEPEVEPEVEQGVDETPSAPSGSAADEARGNGASGGGPGPGPGPGPGSGEAEEA